MELFDGHCDTISRCLADGTHLLEREGHLDLKRMAAFRRYAQFFALYADDAELKRGKSFLQIFNEQYNFFCREALAYSDRLNLCRTGAQAEEAFQQSKTAAFLSIEGAELIECDMQYLENAFVKGVRAVNITWNRANLLSGSNCDDSNRGLSRQGRAFVRKMQELGMLADLSHISDPGFWDVLEIAEKPIIASHSNSRTIHFCQRNLTDKQFTAIIENRGVAGLCMFQDFLGEDAGLDSVIDHLEHFLSLGGEESISIGGDWDGCARLPRGLSGIQDIEKLRERLLRRNYSESLIGAIFYSNLMRVVNEVCTM